MMEKMSKEQALSYVDALMEDVTVPLDKQSLEMHNQYDSSAGQSTVNVSNVNNAEQHTAGAPSPGRAEKEMVRDVNVTPNLVAGNGVANVEGGASPIPSGLVSDFNVEEINEINSLKKESSMANKTQILGDRILSKLQNGGMVKTSAEQLLEKLSAEELETVGMIKEAADAHYQDYVTAWAAGFAKKAEQIEDVMESAGIGPEEAEEVLNEVAQEDPELIMPDEEGEGDEEVAPEEIEMLEQLADELAEAGVTPEELEELKEEIAAEDGATLDAMPKEASERKASLKAILNSL